jgi:hypothetical protein
MLRILTHLAVFIALLLIMQGILGLAAPETFVRVVRFFQTPPVIYLAAVLRVTIGLVLVCAAAASRAPKFLRSFGSIIVIGGVLTPFIGIRFAHLVLDWWSAQGPALVRVFAGVSLALGLYTAYAMFPKRHII